LALKPEIWQLCTRFGLEKSTIVTAFEVIVCKLAAIMHQVQDRENGDFAHCTRFGTKYGKLHIIFFAPKPLVLVEKRTKVANSNRLLRGR
jgi:hypothetical protein